MKLGWFGPPDWARQSPVTLKHKGSYKPVSAGCPGLIFVKTKPDFATANCLPRPAASFPRRRESRGIHSVHRGCVLTTVPPAPHPRRTLWRGLGSRLRGNDKWVKLIARRGLAPDEASGLVSVKTKHYLCMATANHPPHPTPSFPRRRESRGIHSVHRVCALTTAPPHTHGARGGAVWVPACAGTTSG